MSPSLNLISPSVHTTEDQIRYNVITYVNINESRGPTFANLANNLAEFCFPGLQITFTSIIVESGEIAAFLYLKLIFIAIQMSNKN